MNFGFNTFVLDTDTYVLTKGSEPVALEPRVFTLLQFLIENRDRVVSKDDIINQVWEGRIVSDAALNSAINAARRAVDDDGKAQAIIKTFPRRGFRFVAEVKGDEPGLEANEPLAVPDNPSIVVLPFTNLSGDPEQEYFSDGVTGDIIVAISRIRQFFVIASNTSFTFKGHAVDVQAVAKELGVRYVLEGSIRKAGDRVRITAQLIEGATGNNLWAEKYDRELEDIFAVQDEITQTVVGAIEPELNKAERERAKLRTPGSLDTWDLYQQGMAHAFDNDKWGRKEHFEQAIDYFEQAIQSDPTFAPAYASLAHCRCLYVHHGYSEDPKGDNDKGLKAAKRSVELNHDAALTHTALGTALSISGTPNLAIPPLEKSIELNPNSASAMGFLAMSLTLTGEGEKAIPYFDMAMRLSPRDTIINALKGLKAEACLQIGQYEKALHLMKDVLTDPGVPYWANGQLVCILAHMDRLEEAQEAMADLLKIRPDYSIKHYAENFPMTDEGYIAHFSEGLRKAGVPEE